MSDKVIRGDDGRTATVKDHGTSWLPGPGFGEHTYTVTSSDGKSTGTFEGEDAQERAEAAAQRMVGK